MNVAMRRFALLLTLTAAAGSPAFASVDAPASASQPWIPTGAEAYSKAAPLDTPAVPNRDLSLGDLIDLALRDNPDTRGSWQVAVQAASTLNKATGAFLPQVAVGVSMSKQYQKTDGALSSGSISVPQLQIVNSPSVFTSPSASLSWMLWDFGTSKAGRDAAKAGLIAANFQHNRTLQGVVRQVQGAYFSYDSARGALAAADASADLAAANLNQMLVRRHSGLAGLSEEMQTRQGELSARLQREQARLGFEQAKAQLYELAGLPPSAQVTIAEQPAGTEAQPALAAVDSLVRQALATRPDIAAHYAQVAALESDLKRVQRSFLPTISLSASANRLRGEQAYLTSSGVDNPAAVQQAQVSRYTTAGYIDTVSGGISINANLTSLFAYNQAVKAKRASLDAAKSQLDQAILAAEHDVWMSVDACQSARTQFAEARELLQVSQKAYEASVKARDSGLQSTIDLLQSQQCLAQARYTLVDARSRMFTSAANLAFATGATPMGSGPSGG
ncbi:MAG TPA: TolC family protein [Opitutaceae bacterium]|jgi:outer membrane protein TolC|nr:TolC family protein [Opitutaceae bacterium]